jgi:S-formylglutathione hydrolase
LTSTQVTSKEPKTERGRRWPVIEIAGVVLCAVMSCTAALGQSQVVVEHVHSPSLEHNLLGDTIDQEVGIYLPAAYRDEPSRRFATIYFLHGFADTPVNKVAEIFQIYMDKLIQAHTIEPMIIVAPNGLNRFFGSFYTNSPVTGNWDDYVTRDVVNFVDSNYRTIAAPEARGISGHSMGGYGSLMLSFKHPDVFGDVYAMSPCCTILDADFGPSNALWAKTTQIKSADELKGLLKDEFDLVVFVAMDAAFAPDTDNRPMLGDPPFREHDGALVPDPAVLAKFQQNMVANVVPVLLPKIRQLKGIYIEYGAEDEYNHIPPGARALSAQLANSGVPHIIEVYEGTHGNHVIRRVEERMLPWFSKQLKH